MANQGSSGSDATTHAGGGFGAQTWNFGGGINKGVPMWVWIAAAIGAGVLLWRMAK